MARRSRFEPAGGLQAICSSRHSLLGFGQMDTVRLIDAVVRHTTAFIAQLSTSAGLRAPLAHIADQVFLDLSREIEAQGVSRKVVASMFGMALRGYQRKVQRLEESASFKGKRVRSPHPLPPGGAGGMLEWKGKAYDAGRLDLMVVRVTQPKSKAYAYSREGNHGNEKEVVFASGAQLTRARETHIADIPASKVTSGFRRQEKVVPAYLVEVEIS